MPASLERHYHPHHRERAQFRPMSAAASCSHLDQVESIEPGEHWSWCVPDEAAFVLD